MRQNLSDYRIFWREFRQTYRDTGAVMPSGSRLARALTRCIRQGATQGSASRKLLEVGPGTGAVTQQILAALRPQDRLTLVELNERFADRLRVRFREEPTWQVVADRVEIVRASVEDLPEAEKYDAIVSGLPLNNFPVELVERLVSKMLRLLSDGGTLSFFEYMAIRRAKAICSGAAERSRLRSIEAFLERLLSRQEFRRDRVWANVPPAWVHHLR